MHSLHVCRYAYITYHTHYRMVCSLVHAVHPVEEGNVQIHPSSQTPPRMLFALTSSSSCYSSSSSFLHSSAAVRLLSAFKEAGKPQEDTKDSVIISVNLGHE